MSCLVHYSQPFSTQTQLLSMKSVIGGSSSDTSSEENDHQKEYQDDFTSSKRSYDCTFCRRGFNNAQALGGHMNIHRKDKAKAKQGTPNNLFTKEEYIMVPSFIPQRNYDIHFQPSSIPNNCSRNQPSAYAFQYEFLNPTRYESLSTNYEEFLGPNLTLQIGPSHVSSDEVSKGIQNDGEVVDLELRLSHYPY